MAKQNAIQDDNQIFALLAHTGTAGTAETVRVVADSAGNLGVNVVSGEIVASLGTVDVLKSGTVTVSGIESMNSVGTVGVLNAGSVVVTEGTVTTNMGDLTGGTIDEISNIAGGTISAILGTVAVSGASAGTIVQVETGTIASIGNIAGGTIGIITAGTITPSTTVRTISAGTVTELTNLANLAKGTITVIPNIPGGTIGVVSSVANLAAGTVTSVGNLVGGTVGVVSSVGNLVTGTVAAVTSVSNLAAGTISAVNNIVGGTIRNDSRPTQNILTYGTTFGGGAAAYGTLIAPPGVGTSIWINDVSIVNTAGTITCAVTWGSAVVGTAVVAKGSFGATGGIQKSFPKAVNGGATNTALMAYVGAAGTADFVVSYFVSA